MLFDDLFCRAVLFPKAWPNNVFDVEALLRLDEISGADDRYAMSVGSRYILKDEVGAHYYGCATAEKSNQRLQRTAGRQLNTLGETVHYLGFYDLRYGEVTEIKLTCYDVIIKWRPEDGEDAHFQVELVGKVGDWPKKQRKNERRDARAFLALCLDGPRRHVCDCDSRYRDDLSAIVVPTYPSR
jgi:hypothetical protein